MTGGGAGWRRTCDVFGGTSRLAPDVEPAGAGPRTWSRLAPDVGRVFWGEGGVCYAMLYMFFVLFLFVSSSCFYFLILFVVFGDISC